MPLLGLEPIKPFKSILDFAQTTRLEKEKPYKPGAGLLKKNAACFRAN
jgi:hypothetical protein